MFRQWKVVLSAIVSIVTQKICEGRLTCFGVAEDGKYEEHDTKSKIKTVGTRRCESFEFGEI